MKVPRFFVTKENIQGGKAILGGAELEHMRKVLRLRPGDQVTLFDDGGWEHEGVIQSCTSQAGEIELLRSYQPGRESALEITLAQALGKGEKMDLVVEKATELGVQTIVPFLSSYTVPRLDGRRVERRHGRWGKIALSAAKQSGRTRIPRILELDTFETLVGKPWPCELKLLFWEGEPVQTIQRVQEEWPRLRSVLLAIGPEGGFTAEEVEQASRQGFRAIHLGKRILRAETAALAAVSIIQFLWGDMG